MLGTTIDTAIGIVFIFMLFSLFLSTGLEAISTLFALRARGLEITIAQLLESPDRLMRFAHWPAKGGFGLLDALFKQSPPDDLVADSAVDAADVEIHEAATEDDCEIAASEPLSFAALYTHPMVSELDGRKPVYVPAAGFASALISTLLARQSSPNAEIETAIATLPPGRLRVAMLTAFHDAGGDLDAFRTKIEAWYDNAMDRLSGEYKRFSQAMTFAVALILAITFNLDTIAIAGRLATDLPLRAALVSAATQAADHPPTALATPTPTSLPAPAHMATSPPAPTPEPSQTLSPDAEQASLDRVAAAAKSVAAARGQLDDALSLFPAANDKWSFFKLKEKSGARIESLKIGNPLGWFLHILPGLILTALAGMLGGPFWFELLQKLVNLRGAGPKPPRSDSTEAN